MPIGQLILEILQTIIWPLVIIFAITSLKRPLAKLVPLAKRLKYKELEIEFSQSLETASKDADEAFPNTPTDRKSQLVLSAVNLPNATLLESWNDVKQSALSFLSVKGLSPESGSETQHKDIEDLLVDNALIDTKKLKVYSELRQLRNKVAHAKGFEIEKAEAIQYVELCFILIEFFKASAE